MRKLIVFIMILGILGCQPVQHIEPAPPRFIYDEITIEILTVSVANLDDHQINKFKDFCNNTGICEADKIDLIYRPNVQSNMRSWTEDELYIFHDIYRTLYDDDPFDRKLKVFMLVIPGDFDHPTMIGIEGIAFQGEFIAYFNDGITRTQGVILTHELCHVIGIAMNRGEQPNSASPNHCLNSGCIMFWQVSSDAQFCDECKEEILDFSGRILVR